MTLPGGVEFVSLQSIGEERGALAIAEIGRHVPFTVRRVFFLHGVPADGLRGDHAHRRLHQFVVCMVGSVLATVSDGKRSASVQLRGPDWGLYLPPLVWGRFQFGAGSALAVLCSDVYDASDYITDYAELSA